MKRFVAIALCLIMLPAVFAGCNKTEPTPTASSASAPTENTAAAGTAAPVEYEETVYLAYTADINSGDPYYSASSAKLITTNSTFRTLTWYNYDTGKLDPVLMTSWEYNKDNTEFTGKLREGVKFHDGTDFTAEDVEFTWNYAKDIANVKCPIPNADKMVSKVEVIDDYTIKFYLNGSMTDLQDYLQIQIYSKEAWDKLPAEEAGIIGCGPYTYAGREAGVSWTIERFDGYYEGIENYPTKKFVFKVLTDETARAAALETGEIDVNLSVSSASVATLKANKDVAIDNEEGLTSTFIGFNQRRDIWKNVDARKAIAMSINKQDIVDIALNGGVGGAVSNNLIAPSAPGYKDVNYIKYDASAAKALWEEVGYKEKIKLITYPARKAIAEAVQASAKQNSGIDIEVEIVEQSNFNAILNEGNYDMFINYIAVTGGLLYQPGRYFSKGGAQNQYGYDGIGYAEQAAYVSSASDYNDTLKRFAELQQWFADNVILFPLVVQNSICATRNDVQGLNNRGTPAIIEVSTIFIQKRS